jgi:tetratricopeptide (TPR) repeat protein/predicted Ser/Thr protein kinase
VLGRIGSGGMGVVYAAFDAKLDRKVALKLLHRRSDAQERLLREARTMAKLNHPNVVVIHDVGSHDGAVYMAMEFAEGVTLRRWLADAARSHAEVLDVFVQAGEGLAAAHEVRLVHRDFKPENVIVADNGHVKVMDFGLARLATDSTPGPPSNDEPGGGDVTDGGMVGTPWYMAPEQFAREPVSEKTDQFAFCVALYEALYGERPFTSDLIRDRIEARVCEPPGRTDVPAPLRAVIVRGLARRPEDRHPDMRTLLAALRARPRSRRRFVLAGFFGGIALVAGGIGITLDVAADRKCIAVGDAIASTWNEQRSAELEQAFLVSDAPFAADAASRVVQRLDEHAAGWREARMEVCRAHERWVAADVPAPPEAQCLERLRGSVELLVQELVQSGRRGVLHGPRATASLVPAERCFDADHLARVPDAPADPSLREEYERVLAQLRAATVALELGRRDESLAAFEAALRSAVALGHDPLVVHARYLFGRALHRSKRNAEAREHLEAAYFLAGRTRQDEVAAKAAALLASSKAADGPSAEAELWGRNAMMMADRGNLEGTWDFTYVLDDLAVMYDRIGDLEQAVAHLRRSDGIERALGPPYRSAATISSLGEALRRLGRFDEAETMLDEAIALGEEISGLEHPDLAIPLLDRGSLQAQVGRFDRALADLRRAEEIAERGGDPDRLLTTILGALGAVQAELGDYDAALLDQRRALALQLQATGADHPDVGTWHMNLGVTLVRLGRFEEALEHYERAIEIRTAVFGAEHPALVSALVNLGELRRRQGQFEASVAELERARAIATAHVRVGHPLRLAVDVALGETLLDRGDHERAGDLLRETLRTVDDDTPPATRAALEHDLALALVGAGGNRIEAQALAEAAAHHLEASGADPERLAKIRAWLDHPPR